GLALLGVAAGGAAFMLMRNRSPARAPSPTVSSAAPPPASAPAVVPAPVVQQLAPTPSSASPPLELQKPSEVAKSAEPVETAPPPAPPATSGAGAGPRTGPRARPRAKAGKAHEPRQRARRGGVNSARFVGGDAGRARGRATPSGPAAERSQLPRWHGPIRAGQ